MADEETKSQEQQAGAASQGEASAPGPEGAAAQPAEASAAVATAEPPAGGDPPAEGALLPDGQALAEGAASPDGAAVQGGFPVDIAAPPLPEEELSDEVRRILHISVPVIVKLADKHLPLGEIIDLSSGSIVEFARGADTPLELMVNNKVIGRGMAVKVGEKFGLRIDEIVPVEDTIRSLGA